MLAAGVRLLCAVVWHADLLVACLLVKQFDTTRHLSDHQGTCPVARPCVCPSHILRLACYSLTRQAIIFFSITHSMFNGYVEMQILVRVCVTVCVCLDCIGSGLRWIPWCALTPFAERLPMRLCSTHTSVRAMSLIFAHTRMHVHDPMNRLNTVPHTCHHQVSTLRVFFKQRNALFFPSWTFTIPPVILRVPFSAIDGLLWSLLVYWITGMAPSAGRFFIFLVR